MYNNRSRYIIDRIQFSGHVVLLLNIKAQLSIKFITTEAFSVRALARVILYYDSNVSY